MSVLGSNPRTESENAMKQPVSGERYRDAEGRLVVFDGFGSEWLCCADPGCDLQVVRPGKVQCNGAYRNLTACPNNAGRQERGK